jgi:YjbE family integral membrane protein
MAAGRLPAEQRRKAIIWGGAGAVGLRVIFTIMASLLLGVPLLQATGALLLLYIAFKLLKPAPEAHATIREANSFSEALKTIILADVVMSLDNILAVGGAASGHIWLLIFGLALSIPILLFGSNLIANLINRFPLLNYFGAGILIITAIRMFFHDALVSDALHAPFLVEVAVIVAALGIILGAGYYMNLRARQQMIAETNAQNSERPESLRPMEEST